MTDQIALLIVVAIGVSFLLRLIYYHAKLKAITHYFKEYERFCEATSSDPTNHGPYADLLENQTEIVKLFKQSHLSPATVSFVEPVGYGFVQQRKASSWDNLHHNSAEYRLHNKHTFHKSVGYFRARRNETISPVFWIETFLIWPKSLLGFLGFDEEGFLANRLNTVILILEAVGGIIFLMKQLQ